MSKLLPVKPHSIVVFGARPNDVEVAMAGTISRLAEAGNEVHLCIAMLPKNCRRQMEEARMAGRILGAKDVSFLSLTAGEFDCDRTSIEAIDQVVQRFAPRSIFTPWIGEAQPDHVNLTRCIIAATRRNRFNLYMYEQSLPGELASTAFHARYVVDIGEHMDKKLLSVQVHFSQSESRGDGWIDGIRGCAMLRGQQIGREFAEAFDVIEICNDSELFATQLSSARRQLAGRAAETSTALP